MAGNIPGVGGYSPEQLAQMAQYYNAMQANPHAPNAAYNAYSQPPADMVSFSGGQEQPQEQKKSGVSTLFKLAVVAAAGFLAYKYIPAVNKFCKDGLAKLGFGKKAAAEIKNKKVGTAFSDKTPGLQSETKRIKNEAIAGQWSNENIAAREAKLELESLALSKNAALGFERAKLDANGFAIPNATREEVLKLMEEAAKNKKY